MSVLPRLRIKKYFGSATVQQMEFTLEEAKDYLAYFFTRDGSSNITVSVEGEQVVSYDALARVVKQDCLKDRAFVDVGLFLSNQGFDSIWPKRPQF